MDKSKAFLVFCIIAMVLAVSVQECQCIDDVLRGIKKGGKTVGNFFEDKVGGGIKNAGKKVGGHFKDAGENLKKNGKEAGRWFKERT